MPRIEILHPASVEASQVYKVLVPGLRELGYVEGRNIVLELRSGLGKPDTLPKLAVDLVRLNVDVVLAVGRPAVSAAIDATRSIPIVAIDLDTDPVASGWIANMARPGGNGIAVRSTKNPVEFDNLPTAFIVQLRKVVQDAL